MKLLTLQADRLRNLNTVAVELHSGLTVIAGKNGQGKTSLLEAIYFLATGRSFRTRRLDEIVAWDSGPARVAGRCESRLGHRDLTATLENGTRRLMVDGMERDLESYLGSLDLVDLTSERLNVLRGAPSERRKFIDRGVVGLRPSTLRILAEYRRVLQHRNALLRGGGGRDAELDAWEERLVTAAKKLHEERRSYVERLAGPAARMGREILPDGGKLAITYRPSPSEARDASIDDFSGILADRLRKSRPRDLALGHTGDGPHRDDLAVELKETDLRRFGSAGQVRASVVALKLAKLCLLREERGDAPLFLMDDFDSDLDEVRMGALADFLERGGFQAVVATSKEEQIGRLGVTFLKLRMDNGAAIAA